MIFSFFRILGALALALNELQASKEDYLVPHPQEEQSDMLSVAIEGEEDSNEKQLMTRKTLEM